MMDLVLELWVATAIERTKAAWMLGGGSAWRPGERLKLLCAGYNGTRNTGSDVRVEEMLRQVRCVLGPGNIALSVMTQDFNRTRGYFGDAQQVYLPDVFPPFLYREVRRHHGVIACEGSMFKSKFADALTTMMIGSLGIAAAENKISLGYGAEAGHMNPFLARLCARYCSQSLILTRNEASQSVLSELGIPSELGADSAWTFEPHAPQVGRRALVEAGWDGRTLVLAVCPIHPFWWPVRPSLGKFVAHQAVGAYKSSHYRTLYFHKSGAKVDAAFEHYISNMARAVAAFRDRHGVFVILCAMEELDERACQAMAARMDLKGGRRTPIFASAERDMYEMVSILRACDWMISSRYHGMVTSMPALVPAAGVTMDERIRNLLHEQGREDLLLTVEDPDLEVKLLMAMETLRSDADAIRSAIGRTVVDNLKRMASMGVFLEQNVHDRYPDFPIRGGVRSWEEYLPPLSPTLLRLIEKYESSAAAFAAG
jgi:polysaccharide pyruvyl transferase WcaK-like protein